jgi:hypothetical protein
MHAILSLVDPPVSLQPQAYTCRPEVTSTRHRFPNPSENVMYHISQPGEGLGLDNTFERRHARSHRPNLSGSTKPGSYSLPSHFRLYPEN